jgi:signal transduction histidine kinase
VSIFSSRIREIGIISTVVIIVFSLASLLYVQDITINDIKNNLLLQQTQRQVASTRDISLHIGSDLNLILGMLDGLANSIYMQQGNLYGNNATKLMEEKYIQFDSVIKSLFVLDKDNIVTISLSPAGSEGAMVGADYSLRDWVVNSRQALKPIFSSDFERQGIFMIYMSYPIISRHTGQYMGTIVASIPSESFFAHYGNVEHINTQFLVAYDLNGTMLANGASNTFIGHNFFDDYAQQFNNHNPILSNLTRNLLAGTPGSATYDYGRGERLATSYPILVNGKYTYFISMVTPLAQVYSDVNVSLSNEQVKMFMLLGGTFSAIAILIIILIKWNIVLDSEVTRRTTALDLSNQRLAVANEQLKIHDKMQKEFINIAAHELRTPIQPIIGLSEVLRSKKGSYSVGGLENQQQMHDEFLDVIIRNAKRLGRLTQDILDITKIESQSLMLNKEKFNLNQLISDAVEDYKNQLAKENTDGKNIQLEIVSNEALWVEADRTRIHQVLSNLLSNAIKFTIEGTISIITERKDNEIFVSVSDVGTGIHSEILPKLFTKFTTKSNTGTGLGLYISKSIVEAHGGRIWAKNNADSNMEQVGATFTFSIPSKINEN